MKDEEQVRQLDYASAASPRRGNRKWVMAIVFVMSPLLLVLAGITVLALWTAIWRLAGWFFG